MATRQLSTKQIVNLSSDPSSGSTGEIYYNTSSNSFKYYNGSSWVAFSGGGGGLSNSFETINVPNGTDPVADSSSDTLNITESNGIVVTGNSTTDTIDISTNATSLNTASTIISRDSSQSFDITGIDFDTTDTISAAVGRLSWDDGEGTLTLGLKGGNVNLSVGQEVVALCYNGTGSTINKGSVVYISGAQGQRPSITLSDADTEVGSSKTFGVVAENILNGAEGLVCTFGIVTGIDTSSFTEGQALWLSSTAGQLTNVMPTQPAHSVFVGYCLSVNSSSGRIFVNPQNGYELQELHNVLITSVADNHILSYDNATSLWKNQALVDAIKEVDGSGSGIDADLLDGQHGSHYLDWTNTTNKPDPTITLAGDLSGSVTLTDLASGTLTATVADDSHNHTTSTITNFTEDVQDVVGGMVSTNTESGIAVTYDDTNGKLDFDVNDPTITLSGDVTGSATMTNLGNVTITTAIAADSVALGTDTTGNYVATIAGTTNQISVTGSGSETAAVTLSTPQDIHTAANPTFAGATLDSVRIGITAAGEIDTTAGNLTLDSTGGTVLVDDNLSVTGDLTVNGTTTTVNSTTVTVDDPIITLGGDTAPTVDDNKDRGIEFRYFDTAARLGFMGYDDSVGQFVFLTNATNTSEVFTGTKATIDANISGSNINAGTVSATYIDSAIARLASPTFTGTVILPTSATGGASIRIPHGTAPSAPTNGDIWTTTGGVFGRINGSTQQLASTTYVDEEIVYSATEPASPRAGTLWIESDVDVTTFDTQLITRWSTTLTTSQSSFSGISNSLTLQYTIGYEQVYLNGVLLLRDTDYTATDGLTIVLSTAAQVGDVLEVISPNNFTSVNTYTQSQVDTLLLDKVSKSGGDTISVSSGTTVPLTINAAASQSAQLLLIQDNSNNTILQINSSGVIQRNTTSSSPVFASALNYSSDANSSALIFNKSRSSTIGTQTIVQQDDALGQIAFRGTDGSAFRDAAAIYAYVDGTPGSSDMPGRLSFLTSSDGTSTPIERMKITSSGRIQIPAGGILEAPVSINAQTGTSYTLVLSDSGRVIEMSNAAANTLNVPTDASVNFPVGTKIDIIQTGAGQTTVAAVTPGTTIINATPGLKLTGQWAAATLIKRAANNWVLIGNLSS